MILNFKKIRFKNFLSYGNTVTEFSFDDGKLNLIHGSNGAGKTTLLEALCYVLFNKPYRKINISGLVNNVNKKNMLVELEFERGKIDFKIVRGVKPDIFNIYIKKEGKWELQDRESSKLEQQKKLELDVLGFDLQMFKHIVCISLSNFTPFLEMKKPERRKVIESIFELRVFTKMRELIKGYKKKFENALHKYEREEEITKEKLKIREENVKKNSKGSDELIEKIDNEIKALEDKNKQYKRESKELSKKLTERMKFEKEKDRLVDRINTHKSEEKLKIKEIDIIKDYINKYKEIKGVCKTCGQTVSEEFKKKILDEKEEELGKELKRLKNIKKIIKIAEDDLSKVNDKIRVFKEIEEEKSELKNKVFRNNRRIDDLNIEKKKILKESIESEDKKAIEDLKDRIKKIKKARIEVEEKLDVINIVDELASDDGIKKAVIRQYLPVINKMVNYYLTKMGLFLEFNFNENFGIDINNIKYKSHDYQNFSGGEKLRLDFSITFALLEVIKMKKSVFTNLLFLDEVIDSGLDSEGIDTLFKSFKELKQNILVISHRMKDLDTSIFDNVYVAEKGNKFSTIRKESI